jgi:hypothetical protein
VEMRATTERCGLAVRLRSIAGNGGELRHCRERSREHRLELANLNTAEYKCGTVEKSKIR